MSDIFREVEEDVRRERMEKLWKKYGNYVFLAAAILVLGVASFTLWKRYDAVQTAKASTAYLLAMDLSGSEKYGEAATAFSQIAKTAPGGYAEIARLSEANALLAAGKSKEAIALYMRIADKDDGYLGQTARMRAAWAEADTAKLADLKTLLAPVDKPDSGWRFMAQEIYAYVQFRDGDLPLARATFQKLAADKDAPDSIKQRADAMVTLIRTGVGNYGTLPPPKAVDQTAGDVPPDAAQKGSDKK